MAGIGRPHRDRATKEEVLTRLDEAHIALVAAGDALSRRFGTCRQAAQVMAAASLITSDWMPEIASDKSDD